MLQVEAVPAFKDNYIWLIEDASRSRAAIVDPGDARPVIDHLECHGLTPVAILVTHHHGDHVGGIRALREHYDIPVYGPANERIPERDHALGDGDVVELPALDAYFNVIDVPGHTLGHIAYFGEGCLFCGDTLFAAGSGAVFEGTFAQMHRSLKRIAELPGDTLMYCAHEYTLENLAFALTVEPDNPDIIARRDEARRTRERGEPTVPSTMALEMRTNPFLRAADPMVVAAASDFAGRPLNDETEVFTVVRQWKDSLD